MIDQHAAARLKGNLSARRFVGVSGPHGWDLGAVNLGRIRLAETQPREGIHWGLREVLPLVEIRIPFMLKLMELDSISRGLKNPDFATLDHAAQKAAWFEESCTYLGFQEAGITGMVQATPLPPIILRDHIEMYEEMIEAAVVALQKSGIGGPFVLALGSAPYQTVMTGDQRGYPLVNRVKGILGGELRWSPALEGGVLFSSREGYFQLTIGQDFSIGYAGHTRDSVELYITESFTFQVLEPAAAVNLRLQK
jgi:uncharacterized linocin/CFP29 family protein